MEVRPFRGVRFSGRPSLRGVLCPPYDVIPPAMARRLRRRPRNAVHLELPAGGKGRYERARRLWLRWLRSGVLEQDPLPSFYVVEECFRTSKGARRRTGVLAALGLDRATAARVLPHERTLSGPKKDRSRLLRALRVNVSPIFGVCPDPGGRLRRLLRAARGGRPAAKGTALGVCYRLWRLDEPRRTAALERFFKRSGLLVADGHHRYEVARGAKGSGVLAYIVPEGDPGLLVHPTHRLIRPSSRLSASMSRMCRTRRMRGLAELLRVLSRARSPYAFGVYDGGYRLMVPDSGVKSGFGTDWLARKALSSMDPADISYVHGAEDAVREARRTGRWALLLKPFTVRDVRRAVSRAGLLPQKSTYFHPKMNAGLVFRPADRD